MVDTPQRSAGNGPEKAGAEVRELEQGWQRSKDKIAERASLTKGPKTRR